MVDPNIKKKANDIRNKIYGKEVRESLASGLEAMSSDVVETVGRQDEVEGQFQDVIDNTTDKDVISAPEIIAARDGKPNLKARLDKENQEVTTHLAQIAPDYSKLNRDGVGNDSPIIEGIINDYAQRGVTKFTFPRGIYRMNDIIKIEHDDIELDFSGSTIHSYAKKEWNVYGEESLFSPHGKIIGGDIIEWMRDRISNRPLGSPHLLTYESVSKHEGTGRINTSNNSYFSVGDEIHIYGITRELTADDMAYSASYLEPRIDAMATVLSIEDGYVYVDYYSPFEFGVITNNQDYQGFVFKVQYLENFTIKNVHFIDKSTFTGNGANPTGREVRESISMIAPILCRNITIENVSGEEHRMNLLNPFYCRGLKIINTSAKNARIWSGGEGYLMQVRGSRDIYIDGAYGEKLRHVVDLSFSQYATIKNVRGLNNYQQDIDLHGICEHDVTFDNIMGTMIIGNTIAYFPNVAKNIKIFNSRIFYSSTASNDKYVENIEVIDSVFETSYAIDFVKAKFKNSTIIFNNYNGNKAVNKRDNEELESELILDGVTFNFIKNSTANPYSSTYFRDYDKIVFNDVNFVFDSDINIPDNVFTVELLNLKDIMFNHVRFNGTNVNFVYRSLQSGTKHFTFKNSFVDLNSSVIGNYLFVSTLNDAKLVMDIRDNHIRFNTSLQWYELTLLHANSTNFPDGKAIVKLKDNILTSDERGFKINTGGSNVKLIDSGNILKGTGLDGFDTERNFII